MSMTDDYMEGRISEEEFERRHRNMTRMRVLRERQSPDPKVPSIEEEIAYQHAEGNKRAVRYWQSILNYIAKPV